MLIRLVARVTFLALVTGLLLIESGGSATAATPVSLVGNGVGSDNTVTATLDAHWQAHATCRAALRAGRQSAALGAVQTSADGGAQWAWAAGHDAPGGKWVATVTCSLAGSHAHGTTRFAVPRSRLHGGRRSLVRPGSLHARAYNGFAGKGEGLGSGGADPYEVGQCTWYAWLKRQDLPWFKGEAGNAGNWYTSAKAQGIPTGTTAVAGAIAVFAPGQDGAGHYGHVAYVESVSGGSITISEANFSGVTVREHIDGVAIEVQKISSSGLHFIYGGPAGNGPGSSAPAPPPPTASAPPGTFPHHVYHTCANGACGLRIHSSPSLSAPVTAIRNDGEEVFIVCQTTGDRVYGSDGSSSEVWDKLSEGDYASDFYIDTSGTSGAFSPPIPRCETPSITPAPPAPPASPAPEAPTPVSDYNCAYTPEAFGHYVPAGTHWGNSFTVQGATITGGSLRLGAAEDGGNHQASIGIFTGGPDTLSGELGSVTVDVSGYGGVSFTFPSPIHVTPGQSLWLVASGIGNFTAYDQNNAGSDGCFIGTLTGDA
jgi:surface antigen